MGLMTVLSLPVGAATPPTPRGNWLHVDLKPQADGVQAILTLDRPVQSLAFLQAGDRSNWQLRTSGIVLQDGQLKGSGGTSFSHVELALLKETVHQHVPGFKSLQAFGDDGQILYAGQFLPANRNVPTEFRLDPGSGVVSYAGRSATRKVNWIPAHGAGYVVFGTSSGREVAPGMVLFASSVPAALQQQLIDWTTPIMNRLDRSLTLIAADRPFLLISLESAGDGQTGIAGDRVSDSAHLELYGSDWQDPPATLVNELKRTIGIELSRFWTMEAAPETAWLRMAGSQWFGLRAAIDPEAPDFEDLWDEQLSDDLNRCASTLDGESLAAASQRMPQSIGASCGLVMARLMDDQLRQAGFANGFAGLWRQLILQARMKPGTTGMQRLAEVYQRLGGPAQKLLSLANDPFPGPAVLAALFNEADDPVQPWPDPLPDAYAQALSLTILTHLAAQDCAASLQLRTFDQGIRVYGDPSCRNLKETSYAVDAVAGEPLRSNAIAALEKVQAACNAGQPVELAFRERSKRMEIPCAAPIPSIMPLYRFPSPADRVLARR